jgi:hypothetical protein
MKNTTEVNEKFYQKIGELFYSIASADRSVETEEISKLKELVRKEWLTVDKSTDGFGTDAAYQIEIIFDFLLDQNQKAETAFESFKNYKEANPRFFTEEMSDLILKTARAIAFAFSRLNKSELIFLEKLKVILASKN